MRIDPPARRPAAEPSSARKTRSTSSSATHHSGRTTAPDIQIAFDIRRQAPGAAPSSRAETLRPSSSRGFPARAGIIGRQLARDDFRHVGGGWVWVDDAAETDRRITQVGRAETNRANPIAGFGRARRTSYMLLVCDIRQNSAGAIRAAMINYAPLEIDRHLPHAPEHDVYPPSRLRRRDRFLGAELRHGVGETGLQRFGIYQVVAAPQLGAFDRHEEEPAGDTIDSDPSMVVDQADGSNDVRRATGATEPADNGDGARRNRSVGGGGSVFHATDVAITTAGRQPGNGSKCSASRDMVTSIAGERTKIRKVWKRLLIGAATFTGILTVADRAYPPFHNALAGIVAAGFNLVLSLKPEVWTALATAAIAMFTATLWWSTRRLWIAGERQLRVARDAAAATIASAEAAKKSAEIAEASLFVAEQPYVIVDAPAFEKLLDRDTFDYDGPAIDPWIHFRLANHGRTPAVISEFCAESACVAELPAMPEYRDGAVYDELRTTLGAGQQGTFQFVFKTPIDGRAMNDIGISAFHGGRNLYAFGFVKYGDIFGRTTTVGFCWRYNLNVKRFLPEENSAYNYRRTEPAQAQASRHGEGAADEQEVLPKA
jgi:hypothetical protein